MTVTSCEIVIHNTVTTDICVLGAAMDDFQIAERRHQRPKPLCQYVYNGTSVLGSPTELDKK